MQYLLLEGYLTLGILWDLLEKSISEGKQLYFEFMTLAVVEAKEAADVLATSHSIVRSCLFFLLFLIVESL